MWNFRDIKRSEKKKTGDDKKLGERVGVEFYSGLTVIDLYVHHSYLRGGGEGLG